MLLPTFEKRLTMNPKALNLESARQSQTKVTTGFKIEPQLKIQFAEKAEELGLTLSKYLGGLVSEQEEIINLLRKEGQKKIAALSKRLALYETSRLKKMFDDEKGKTRHYFSEAGQKIEIVINDLSDVNELIQNSFKIL